MDWSGQLWSTLLATVTLIGTLIGFIVRRRKMPTEKQAVSLYRRALRMMTGNFERDLMMTYLGIDPADPAAMEQATKLIARCHHCLSDQEP